MLSVMLSHPQPDQTKLYCSSTFTPQACSTPDKWNLSNYALDSQNMPPIEFPLLMVVEGNLQREMIRGFGSYSDFLKNRPRAYEKFIIVTMCLREVV